MMIKNLTCIECPKGCRLVLEVENGQVLKVSGQQCQRGEKYAIAEIQNPQRVLTTTVLGQGLVLKMIPVRTDRPMARTRILEAMQAAREVRVSKPVKRGDVIVSNFLNSDVNLIATRDVDELAK